MTWSTILTLYSFLNLCWGIDGPIILGIHSLSLT